MAYALGVDLGTTYTAAAVVRDSHPTVVNLGIRSAAIPSVVFLRDDGAVLVGEAALRKAIAEPGRFAREFKRRLGDPTPILLGGAPWPAEALMAGLLKWVVDTVSEREGGVPGRVAVTHPANWGPHKLDLLGHAARLAEVQVDRYITEPEAAAAAYAATERLAAGAAVAVYDLGGGTFDAAVLRKTEQGFAILGQPEGIERLGGVDFDQALVSHVVSTLGPAAASLPSSDPVTVAALARLRHECVEAKEALSSDSDTSVAVFLPGIQREVRVTRAEFEGLIRPTLARTVSALHRAIRSAEIEPADLAAVLLVGGSSRIPLVAELVSSEVGRPVAVDADPKHAVAIGAALEVNEQPVEPVITTPASPVVHEPSAPATRVPAPVRRPVSRLGALLVAVCAAFTLAAPAVIVKRQAAADSPTKPSTVVMVALDYRPSELVVDRGTRVTFDNRDVAPHTVTEVGGGIDSGLVRPGTSFALVVDRAFEYLCTLHPSMRATVSLSG